MKRNAVHGATYGVAAETGEKCELAPRGTLNSMDNGQSHAGYGNISGRVALRLLAFALCFSSGCSIHAAYTNCQLGAGFVRTRRLG